MEYLKAVTDLFQPLLTDAFYHIYNRGNNGDCLFYKEENYSYFLRKFDEYISPYADVYAYCLLPNHFHCLLKTKSSDAIEEDYQLLAKGRHTLNDFSSIISEAFRRLFLAYAKAIKIQESRTGSLFEKNFKRKMIKDDPHLVWAINYIHRNPESHGLVSDFRHYRHSSYRSFLSLAPTKLKRDEVFSLLGGREEFIRFHATNPVVKDGDRLTIE